MTADPLKTEHLRKRLRFRANHRGIKEMDIVLGGFANRHIETLTEAELDQFAELLEENDQDLLAWFTGQTEFPRQELQPLFKKIAHTLNGGGS